MLSLKLFLLLMVLIFMVLGVGYYIRHLNDEAPAKPNQPK